MHANITSNLFGIAMLGVGMFGNLQKEVEKEHKNIVMHILAKNEEYIKNQGVRTSNYSIKYNSEYRKVVIPKVPQIPRYRFYMHTNNIIAAQDDPILRYVPLIQNNTEYENLLYFEGTVLSERPLDRDEEIKERVMKRVFKTYRDIELFELKRSLVNKQVSQDVFESRFSSLGSLAKYLEIPIYKLLVRWETVFDKERKSLYTDEQAFDFYFCNICFIFDCSIHEQVPCEHKIRRSRHGKQSKAVDINKLHKIHCIPRIRKICVQEEDTILKTFKAERTFIDRSYDVDPCISNLFFYFATGAKISCKSFEKSNNGIILKKEKRSSRLVSFQPDLFYSPCSHIGSCYNNSRCSCWKGRFCCEDSCFCECCDYYFSGCRCKICGPGCRCRSAGRECSGNCNCAGCTNQPFIRGEAKETYIGQSTINGFGLFAGEYIETGSFILEYIGEVITNAEAERRGHFYEKRQISYLFDVSSKSGDVHHTIDAIMIGNNARFINHSIKPNIRARTFQASGIKRIGFYALENIRKHTELFFDYQYKDEHKKRYNIKE